MQNTGVLGLVMQVLLLAGCAASIPTEAGGKVSLSAASAPTESVEALGANCSRLASAMAARVDRMKALQAAAEREREAPAANLWSALQRGFGADGAGIAALEELARERKRADATNAILAAKGCRSVDIEVALRTAATPAAAKAP